MLLQELLQGIPQVQVQGALDLKVRGLSHDSRDVREGDLFVCLPGTRSDGHRFIREALDRGAAALVVAESAGDFGGRTVIRAEDPRRVLSRLAARYYQYPSRSLRLIGVTGTNGKTTTTHLINRLLAAALPRKTGLLGTIGYYLGEEQRPARATTPEAPEIHRLLREMASRGMDYCTMEVSSHALALNRVDQCEFNTAVLTNITEDHLDFHRDFASYREAKARLFRNLPRKAGNYAVINRDDSQASYLQKITAAETLTYGIREGAGVRAVDICIRPQGASFRALTPWGPLRVKLKITGLFSVYNALAALSVALKEGISPSLVERELEKVEGIPGRLEKVDVGQDFTVLVDYAHTPDGLENVLSTVRQFCPGRLITVFGCGGERDRSKRPLMGAIALKYSHYAIITNDNPRGEPVGRILDDILAGIRDDDQGRYTILLDREEAIRAAIGRARAGDMVVLAGKGHETYQVFHDRTIDFDDREAARRCLREKLGLSPGEGEGTGR
jgi:UDP-N-acetylmuramoyl-L-alanyl-D-glutamate--2,6-diaminopimelate ligase